MITNTRKRLNKRNLEEQKEWTLTTAESWVTLGGRILVISLRDRLS